MRMAPLTGPDTCGPRGAVSRWQPGMVGGEHAVGIGVLGFGRIGQDQVP